MKAIDTGRQLRAAWRVADDKAVAGRGVFGPPTVFADGQMFFGNDRPVCVNHTLEAP